MCKEEKYINIQTGEVLDMERVASLKENAMFIKLVDSIFK